MYSKIMHWIMLLAIIHLAIKRASTDKWKEVSDEEEGKQIHRFALEHGLWTPDPSVLVGPHEYSDSLSGGTHDGDEPPPPKSEARFITPNNTFVTVEVDQPATLRCQVDRVANSETISWIRRRDHHLVTLGTTVYTSDGRFHLTHSEHSTEWTLNLKYAQIRDTGMYECQISSHPPRGIVTNLKVIQPVAIIKGSPDMYAQAGSDVTLVCRLRNFTVPPTYVFWYHEEQMINYDTDRKISVVSQGGQSVLRLAKMQKEDSGNYTCVPANAKAATITLHVIPGELPAAMQRATAPPRQGLATLAVLLLISAVIL